MNKLNTSAVSTLLFAFIIINAKTNAQSFTISPSGPYDVCTGGGLPIYVTVDIPDPSTTYYWYYDDYSAYTANCASSQNAIGTGTSIYIDPFGFPAYGISTRVYCIGVDALGNQSYCNPLDIRIAAEHIPVCVTSYSNFCGTADLQPPVNLWFGSTTWYLNGSVVYTNAFSSYYQATQPGYYRCKIQTTCGYSYSDSFYVDVKQPPTLTISASGSTSFCPGGNVILTASSPGSSGFIWYKNNVSTGITGTTYTATTAGNYTAYATGSNGCLGISPEITVTILSTQTISVSDTALCTGDTATLVSSNASTYQWKKNGNNIAGATSQTYKATTTGTYKVTVTGSICSGTAPAVNVKFYALPNTAVTLSGSPNLCFGGGVLMSLPSQGAGYLYQWQKGVINITNATDTCYYTTTAGTYKVVATNPGGCTKKSAGIVVTASTVTLPTQTLTLQPGSAGKDASIASYPTSVNNNYANDPEFNAGTWTISGTEFSIRNLIEFDLSQLPANARIRNAKLSLYFNPANNSFSHVQYGANAAYLKRIAAPWNENTVTWNNQPPVSLTHQVSLAQSTTATQDYPDIDVTDLLNDVYHIPSAGYGFMLQLQTEAKYRGLIFASGDNADNIKHPKLVITYVAAAINAIGSATICSGDSVKLTTNNGSYTWQWYKGGNAIAGATSSYYYAKTVGNYSVQVTNTAGCTATSALLHLQVNTVPNATITAGGPVTFCAGDSVALTANGTTFTYQWRKNNANILGATAKKYIAKTAGNYTVRVTNTNGCSKLSSPVTVTVPCRMGSLISEASVYPNPSTTGFTLHGDGLKELINLRVVDMLGSEILSYNNILLSDDFVFGNELLPGIYFIQLSGDTESKMIKVVKE